MINETLLKEIIISQKKIFLDMKGLFKRKILEDFYKKYHRLKEILIITGVRRSGKSSLMKLIWDDFKTKEKLENDQFLYLNFVYNSSKLFSSIFNASVWVSRTFIYIL